MSTNKLVTCPYDEAHKVKESRLQVHITKCKRNHLFEKEEKVVCTYNASHIINKGEEKYHLHHCPDRAPIDRKLCQNLDRNNPYKGRTDVPSYNASAPIISEEIWDIEDDSPGYIPAGPPVGAILEPPPYSKPAERKKLYQEMHRQPTERDIKPPQPAPSPIINREPRQPTECSKIEMIKRQNAEQYQNLGLGRGKPAAPSRIAANFFPPASDSNHQPPVMSYSSATSSGMNQLGLGRGNTTRPGFSAEVFSNDLSNSEDFPALGIGRGVSSYPRNGAPGQRR